MSAPQRRPPATRLSDFRNILDAEARNDQSPLWISQIKTDFERKMASNDRIILDQILESTRTERTPHLSASAYFQIFTAEQALKDFDLSYEEIESGNIGGSGDGGIDAIYVFANGELVHEDSDLSNLKKAVTLDLVVVQAKTSPGFSETPIDKLISVSEDVLDLSKHLDSFKTTYSETLLQAIRNFRNAHSALAGKFPTIRFCFVYASKAELVHPNTQVKANKLTEKIRKLFSAAEVSYRFLGVQELLALARRTPKTSHTLTLAETPISSSGEVGFVCLVKLSDFFNFITENGQLLRGLFESNVRDYQGQTQVNEEIQDSLSNAGKEDFWWLNNGITVVATQATQSGKALTIEDPQIVNGLQTSTEVFKYFKGGQGATDSRTLLVRVIVPSEAASRDRIIKATNSQTYIPPASLRATDKIHRDIEEYLKPRGLYYDRRKNRYKNEGISLDRIVGIPAMAQAVMAIALRRPDIARSRPSSLLKKDEDYKSIFSESQPIGLYWFCGGLLKRVESALRDSTSLTPQERGNIRFHVAMHVASIATKKVEPHISELAVLEPSSVQAIAITESINATYNIYLGLQGNDQVAKGSEFLIALRADLAQRGSA